MMHLRHWINWKPAATLGFALLAMGGSAAAVVACLRPPATPTARDVGVYFVDEGTGRFARRSLADVAPLPGDSGPEALVGAVFRPEDEPADGAEPRAKPLFLRKYTPEAKRRLDNTVARTGGGLALDDLRAADAGCLVRAPEPGSPWVPAASPEGRRLMHGAEAAAMGGR